VNALEEAARAFVAEVESPHEVHRITSMLGVIATLLGCASREQDLANEPGPFFDLKELPNVEPRTWLLDGQLPDAFRQTMYAV